MIIITTTTTTTTIYVTSSSTNLSPHSFLSVFIRQVGVAPRGLSISVPTHASSGSHSNPASHYSPPATVGAPAQISALAPVPAPAPAPAPAVATGGYFASLPPQSSNPFEAPPQYANIGMNVFNPATDTVISADANSSSVM